MASTTVQVESQSSLWASGHNTENTPSSTFESSPASTKNSSVDAPVSQSTIPDGEPFYPRDSWDLELAELYSENIVAKVFRTATESIGFSPEAKRRALQRSAPLPESTPNAFPEYVPQDGPDAGKWHLREPEFWTCGFFPGSLHGILERLVRFPQSLRSPFRGAMGGVTDGHGATLRSEFRALCDLWAEPLHAMSHRTDTHDVGFIIMPALRLNWELTGNERSLDSILRAAHSLASRYVPTAKAIRSWDERLQKNIQITGKEENLILIVDSLCNLDLLYYAANHSSNEDGAFLYDAATDHADTLLRTHLRPESVDSPSSADIYRGQWYSTYHVANLDPKTGDIKKQFTAQGYTDNSTWARGQAWGILGYAQTYMWTKDKKFLHASCGLAEYFLYRLEQTVPPFTHTNGCVSGDAPQRHRNGRFVPLWDFDDPLDESREPIRDSSAGAIAANGLLVLSQGLAALGSEKLATRFRNAALDITHDLLAFALAPEKARFVTGHDGSLQVEDVVVGKSFDSCLRYGTANNNQHARKQYANHGLVYGDYYLIELGNRILRMGLA